ncbi:MAG: hypothetical protein Q7Q71_15760 [Verrucomicrobiota bacterium JB023]|nr:hypothetical protein [Verrucomicrobiota bacterium JB023]
MKWLFSLLILVLTSQLVRSEATEERVWTSTAQTTITGQALSLANNQVTFETTDGRKLTVPLNKLVSEDQAFLKKHFAGKLPSLPALPAPPNLPYEQGKVHGPIDTGQGSSYYLYLPKSLSAEYPAPLFLWTGSAPSRAGALNHFIEGAELTGMVIAASVESCNKNRGPISNTEHAGNCLEHLEQTLPVEPGRYFFCGQSGGGAEAFVNADTYKSVGVFSYVAYIPEGKLPKYCDYVYAAGGAWDYNRYLSAYAAQCAGKNGTHRLYPGGHRTDRGEVPTEGMCWLYTRELYDNLEGREMEQRRFEDRFLRYLRDDLQSNKPHLAYYWCDHLLEACEIEGQFASLVEEISQSLAPTQQRYLDGRKALDEFSDDHFAKHGESTGSKMKHSTASIKSAAKKLEEEFAGVVDIAETAAELQKPTAGN